MEVLERDEAVDLAAGSGGWPIRSLFLEARFPTGRGELENAGSMITVA